MKNIFHLSLVIKLAEKVLLVLEPAGGGDVLEAVVYVLLLKVPGALGVESSTVEQVPSRFEARSGSWVLQF